MRLALCSSLFLGFLAAHLNADIVVAVATPLGPPNLVQYSFTLSGFDLLQYQVLDIRFNSSVYASLSAPFAPANFSTMDFQPNPTPGDFLVEALISNPALTPGSIGIDATLLPGQELGPLPFFVYQFSKPDPLNPEGVNLSLVSSGTTVPEPAGVSLPVLGLLIAGILGSRWLHRDNRRRNRSRAST